MRRFLTKKSISLLLMLTLMVGILPTAGAVNPGTASEWAKEAVTDGINKGYVPYDLQGNYQDIITRAEFCRMAVKFVEYITGNGVEALLEKRGASIEEDAFADTTDASILAAYALGITNGTDAEKRLFSPNSQFSREQAATMLMNTCRALGLEDSGGLPDAGYSDMSSASGWARTGISFCAANGIMQGTGGNLFDPKSVYTREQSILTFYNLDRSGTLESIGSVEVSGVPSTQAYSAGNWAGISSVQQFAYLDEGLAYAYVQDEALVISMPNRKLELALQYPKLGDVIADEDGYLYIVWGRDNETDDASIETVFISKYSPEGTHIKTTGFVGESSPWGSSNSAKTKQPFRAGGCVSAIANGILVNYHSKQRYDGHQSDIVIAVNMKDMSPVSSFSKSYSGHSFHQSMIYCEKTADFLFASHGDAYARGFRVNSSSGGYGDEDEILFHFYLEANASYNMWVVNKTFAQLGGLAETSRGVALVGASAKSIGEAAKEEKQNLFVQIFDPTATGISASMFVGGTARSGATSFDINDRNNSPLTPVTDYGVHWLTDYTDTDVIAPQVVAAEDRLVLLWSTVNDTFYMVLSADGEVLTPETALGSVPLNSFEPPVYHNGAVYWASVYNNRLTVHHITL